MNGEIKIFSIAFLDLLSCALGAVILLGLMMIVSMSNVATQSIKRTYFMVDAVIWIRLPDQQPLVDDELETLKDSLRLGLALYYAKRPEELDAALAEASRQMDARFIIHRTDDLDSVKSEVAIAPAERIEVQRMAFEPIVRVFGDEQYLEFNLACMSAEPPTGCYAFDVFFERGFYSRAFSEIRKDESLWERPPKDLSDLVFARLELIGSGPGAHAILQTHPTLPDEPKTVAHWKVSENLSAVKAWKSRSASLQRDLQSAPAGEDLSKQIAQGREAFEESRLPNRYAPDWSIGTNSFNGPKFELVAPRTNGVRLIQQPYFAIVQKDGEEFHPAALCPLPMPDGSTNRVGFRKGKSRAFLPSIRIEQRSSL